MRPDSNYLKQIFLGLTVLLTVFSSAVALESGEKFLTAAQFQSENSSTYGLEPLQSATNSSVKLDSNSSANLSINTSIYAEDRRLESFDRVISSKKTKPAESYGNASGTLRRSESLNISLEPSLGNDSRKVSFSNLHSEKKINLTGRWRFLYNTTLIKNGSSAEAIFSFGRDSGSRIEGLETVQSFKDPSSKFNYSPLQPNPEENVVFQALDENRSLTWTIAEENYTGSRINTSFESVGVFDAVLNAERANKTSTTTKKVNMTKTQTQESDSTENSTGDTSKNGSNSIRETNSAISENNQTNRSRGNTRSSNAVVSSPSSQSQAPVVSPDESGEFLSQGLTDEDMETAFSEQGVRFQTTYIDQVISWKNLMIPEKWRDDLKKFRVQVVSNSGQQQIQVDYRFIRENKDDDGDLPEHLYGYRYDIQQQSKRDGRMRFQVQSQGASGSLKNEKVQAQYRFNPETGESRVSYKLEGENKEINRQNPDLELNLGLGVIKPEVTGHYEHLVIRRSVYQNHSFKEKSETVTEVFSGEEQESLPASGNLIKYERNGEYQDRLSLELDRKYEKDPKELTVVVVHEDDREFREFQANSFTSELVNGPTEIETSGIYDQVRNQAQQVNNTEVLVEDISDFEIKAFNVTVPENSTTRFEAFTESPEGVQQRMSMYVLGSFAGGSGTSSDPFEISNCVQLQEIENGTTGTLSDSYELINDIDCSNSDSYDGGTGFDPIGSQDTPFDGIFNGNNNVIRNIYINASKDTGLFSHLGSSALVKNTKQRNSFVNGLSTYTGGFVGDNGGSFSNPEGGEITNLEFSGTVQGDIVGGIAGSSAEDITEVIISGNITGGNSAGGVVGNSFSSQTVLISNAVNSASINGGSAGGIISRGGSNLVLERVINFGKIHGSPSGGLFGAVGTNNFPTVKKGFSSGRVIGSESGGIFGDSQFAGTEDVYWDVPESLQADSTSSGNFSGINGLNTPEMTGSSASTNMADLSFSNTFETVTRGSGTGEDGYPILQNVRQAPQLNGQGIGNFSGGDGTSGNPLEADNCHQLQDLEFNLTLDYELVSNIDCSKTEKWNDGEGFHPIGGDSFSSKPFVGTLYGRGKTISQLYINRTGVPTGLFSNTQGLIQNLSLTEFQVVNGDPAGTIAGFGGDNIQMAELTHIHSSGNVSGESRVGGLIGSYGRVSFSSFEGEVSGQGNTGGLVGGGTPTIINSTSNAAVESVDGGAGGLSGFASSTTKITKSRALGSVRITGTGADGCAGGIAGEWSGSSTDLSDSFAAVEMSSTSDCIAGVTEALVPSTIESTYWDVEKSGVVNGTDSDGNVTGTIGLRTSKMKGPTPKCQGTMSGLDFRNTWAANESSEYPQLKVFVDQKVASVSNSNAPKGALWVQGNTLHWADGSQEYFLDFREEAACDVSGGNGGFWVQGTTLRWIDQDGDERIYEGKKVGDSVSGPQGSTWFQNGFVHYIDENGDERKTDGF